MTSDFKQALWSKRPTYEEILRDMETDYKVKIPDRVALQFYDSFAMTHFRELQQQTNESEVQKDEHRREAVVSAAADEGVGRQELQQFANQLHQQSQHRERRADKQPQCKRSASSQRFGGAGCRLRATDGTRAAINRQPNANGAEQHRRPREPAQGA